MSVATRKLFAHVHHSMLAHEHSSLIYMSGFPLGHGDFVVHHLFGSSENNGFLPKATLPIEWDYPCEFPCIKDDEPLDRVYARRYAFGGSLARITSDAARRARRIQRAAGVEGNRFLVFAKPGQEMQAYCEVMIRWVAPSLLEVPQFCVSTVLTDPNQIEWGFEPRSNALLRAALTLQPAEHDVFGFCTADERMFGAVEFTSTRIGELYRVHVFSTWCDQRLMVGDELWGWYCGKIGDTQLQAKRLLAVVERLPDTTVYIRAL